METFSNNFAQIEIRNEENKKPIFLKENEIIKVIVRFSGKPTDSEMNDYLAHITKIYELNHPFYIIYDGTDVGLLTPTQVYKQADFMRTKDQDTRRLIIKCAIILTSMTARMTLNTLFTLKPPACKLEVFDNMTQAKIYLKQK